MPNRNIELQEAIEAYNVGRAAALYEESPEPTPEESSSAEVEQLLSGFVFPATKGMPEIYIGKRSRLYLKGAFKTMLGVMPQTRIIIGYNPVEDAFAVVKPEAMRHNREAQAAGYFVSLRYDVTAAKMFKQYSLDRFEGQTYFFDRASSDASVAIFRRY